MGDDGGKSHAENAPVKHKDKHQVQNDVHHAGRGQEEQGRLTVPQTLEDTRIDVVAQASDDTGKNHLEIDMGLIVYISGHPDQVEDRPGDEHPKERQRDDAHHHRPIHRVHRPPDGLPVPRTHKLRDYHASADGEPHKERGEQVNDRESDAHSGQCSGTYEVAHHPGIHHVVKLLESITRQQRQGKPHQKSQRIPLRHIDRLMLFRQTLLPPLFPYLLR